jgi:transcriptional regulator of arginine metabolism
MQKDERQEFLRNLLRTSRCKNQAQVVRAMQDGGFEVTQPLISRDFQELGVSKVLGHYAIVEQGAEKSAKSSAGSVVALLKSSEPVGPNLVVVRTESGAASVVGEAFDRLKLAGIAGSIAGDNTLLIITRNRASQRKALTALEKLRV